MLTRSLDFGKALTFMFEEPDWMKKFLIGVGMVLLAIPLAFLGGIPAVIPIFILTGYSIEISRRKAQNLPTVLPEWEGNWGKYFKDGAFLTLAAIVYALPLLVPLFGFVCATVVLADGSTGEIEGPLAFMGFCLACVTILYIIPLYVFLYGGLVEFMRTGEFRSFFNFRNLAALKSGNDGNPRKNFFLVLLMILVPLSLVGSVIPVLGSIWALYVQGHLFGQILHETGYELNAPAAPGMVNTL